LCEWSRTILFINTSAPSPRPIYIVEAAWSIFYPQQLEHAIAQAGFTTITNDKTTGKNIIPECGWQTLQSITALGVRRGRLGINNQTDGLPLPQLGLEDTVSALMSSQYPYVEITFILTFVVWPIIVVILTAIAVKLSKKLDRIWIRWRKRKLQESIQKPPKPMPNRLKEIKKFNRPSNEKSRILHIPDELQLQILTYMDYESVCALRSTCKFYNELIDDSILKPLQTKYIETMIAWERSELATRRSCSQYNLPTPTRQFTALYCTNCRRPRPTSTFSINSQQMDPFSRVCLPCKYAADEYSEGLTTATAYNALFYWNQQSKHFNLCSVCKSHNLWYMESVRYYEQAYTCQRCANLVKHLYSVPSLLIPFEFVFALIAWALESSGTYNCL